MSARRNLVEVVGHREFIVGNGNCLGEYSAVVVVYRQGQVAHARNAADGENYLTVDLGDCRLRGNFEIRLYREAERRAPAAVPRLDG